MGAVDLDPVEPGLVGPDRGGDEIIAQLLDLGGRKRASPGLGIGKRALRGLADQIGRAAHPGVVELDRGQAAIRAQLCRQRGQPRQVIVRPDPELAGKALALALDMGGGGHHQPEAALGAHRQPVDLVIGQGAVGMALQVGQRGQHEAVGHGRATGKGQRLVAGGHGGESPRLPAG